MGWELLQAQAAVFPGARTLDIGCAFGHVVLWMQRAGARATGIDISPESVAWGRAKLGLDLRQVPVESLAEPHESFDVITMLDVIEHIVDLGEFGRRLVALLKPGGLLYVQTPNFGAYQTFGERCSHLRTSLEHLLTSSERHWTRCLRASGLTPACPTRVFCVIPCDGDEYLASRRPASGLRAKVARWPGADYVRLLRSRVIGTRRVYTDDESGREGSTLVAMYRKPAATQPSKASKPGDRASG